MFNNCIIIINNKSLYILQKSQKTKIKLVNITNKDYKQAYIKQRAYKAYLIIIC